MKAQRRIVQVKIANLKPHPLNGVLFRRPTEQQMEQRAEDIRLRGLQHPIEILPDDTIICGHCRVEALKLLGHKTVAAIVRADLAAKGEAGILEYMIGDNLHRRHLGPLERARCAVSLLEIAGRRVRQREEDDESADGEHRPRPDGRARDVVGKILICDGRTVDRYLRVLKAPPEVQEAFDRGKLKLVTAGQIASLTAEQQDEIVAAIRAGQSPQEVADKYVQRQVAKKNGLHNAYPRFLRHVRTGMANLADREEMANVLPDHIETFEAAIAMIQKLIQRGRDQLDDEE
ncbi:MAG: ParB/RepB/Spo0J family partition protein [Planctomycetes bacterium]|nr:ParB/RepB/Spo0J family partition protein [Planctomycetota bacterium]